MKWTGTLAMAWLALLGCDPGGAERHGDGGIATDAPSPPLVDGGDVGDACTGARPARTSETRDCADALGPVFEGDYTAEVDYRCVDGAWTPRVEDDASAVCHPRFAPLSSLPAGDDGVVTVPADTTVYIDASLERDGLVVAGTLRCGSHRADRELVLEHLVIADGGRLVCGTERRPFRGDLTVSLTAAEGLDPRSSPLYRGLVVRDGGALSIHAPSPTGPFVRLGANLPEEATTLTLDGDVDWAVGDRIAVGSTTFDFQQAESFTIVGIEGRTLELDRPAEHFHWGDRTETYDTARGPVTLDQRAEVTNLSRRVVIQAHDPDGALDFDRADAQHGAHVMIQPGGSAWVDGLELRRVGQAGILGRYPFHWHLGGDVGGQYLRNASIHESFQRCVTVHGSRGALVENDTCYRYRGHGFFLEDGTETDNVLRGNLAMSGHAPMPDNVLLESDDPRFGLFGRFGGVSAFWIAHPANTVEDNVASGSEGVGFWNAFAEDARHAPTTRFADNVAHSTRTGITWDGAPDFDRPRDPPNSNNPDDHPIVFSHYAPPGPPVFRGLVVYKNLEAGIYFRGQTAVFEEAVAADNVWSFFLAYHQIVRNSAIVGRSANFGAHEEAFLADPPTLDRVREPAPLAPADRRVGVILYDGPLELDGVDFLDFPTSRVTRTVHGRDRDVTTVPISVIGGSEKLINLSRGLRFAPDPARRLSFDEYSRVWADAHLAQGLRDLDGTLTGTPGAIVLGDHPFSHTAACAADERFYRARVCPAGTEVGALLLHSATHGGFDGVQMFHALRRQSDGAVSVRAGEADERPFFRKTFLVGGDERYQLLLRDDYSERTVDDASLQVAYYAETPATALSPVFRLRNYGSGCRVVGAPSVASVAALESAGSTAYHARGHDLWFRLAAHSDFFAFTEPSSVGGQAQNRVSHYRIDCDGPITHHIVGRIDEVRSDGLVRGWACSFGEPRSIGLHLYVGGSAGGGGAHVGSYTADQPSEEAVGFACGDGSFAPHRFSFRLTHAQRRDHAGQRIYLHGLNDRDNGTIARSGELVVPAP